MTSTPDGSWFNAVADFLGRAYLRNAFTKGTEQEVSFLVDALALQPGTRVLDVGCGPGRHALALARRGMRVHGVDLSDTFVALARETAASEHLDARFDVMDVRDLGFDAQFDAAICLCQGGFGLLGGRDEEDVLARIGRAVRPGGALALTAFSSYFAVRFLEAEESFDASTGVLHERSTVRADDGSERDFDLWTTCFTARELRLLAGATGLVDVEIHAATPGRYGRRPPSLDEPELLMLARRPGRPG